MRNVHDGSTTLEKAGVAGAILHRGDGLKLNSGDNHIHEDFDFWVIATNAAEIIKAEDDRVVVGDTIEDVEQRIRETYPTEEGSTRIDYCERVEVRFYYRDKEDRGYRRRDRHYRTEYVTGWQIMKYPVAVHPENRTELRMLCNAHDVILIETEDYNRLGQDGEYRAEGFTIASSGGGSYMKLRWNPKNAALQDHNIRVKTFKRFTTGELPNRVLYALGEMLNYNNWPEQPFGDVLKGVTKSPPEDMVTRRKRLHNWNYHRPSSTYSPASLLSAINLAKKLRPGGNTKPWRHLTMCSSQREASGVIESAMPYIHGLLIKPANEQYAALGKWLRIEARHFKIKLPPKPRVPAKPRFKGGLVVKTRVAEQPLSKPVIQPVEEPAELVEA